MTTIGELAQCVIDALESDDEDWIGEACAALVGALHVSGELDASELEAAEVETGWIDTMAVTIIVGDRALRVETDGTVEWLDAA